MDDDGVDQLTWGLGADRVKLKGCLTVQDFSEGWELRDCQSHHALEDGWDEINLVWPQRYGVMSL
jgi:hypothetical protein